MNREKEAWSELTFHKKNIGGTWLMKTGKHQIQYCKEREEAKLSARAVERDRRKMVV